jgi:pimeloyl-ACP methyl ester carboxylesterase
VVAPDLPFNDPAAGYEQRIQPALDGVGGVDGPLVVVGHSMASGVAPLIAAARPVSLLVLLCPGPLPTLPDGPSALREGFPFPATRADGTNAWDRDEAIDVMYRRLPQEQASALAERLQPMAPAPDEYPLRGHPDVPTVVVYATEDELFDPAIQRARGHALPGAEPIEIGGGHFPMVEDPDALVVLLDALTRQSPSQPGTNR